MSRNLLRTNCYFCGAEVAMIEAARPITEADAGVYYSEFETMLVADAECVACAAKYLAWVKSPTQGTHKDRHPLPWEDGPFYDLSFRSSFNDEPNDEDLPQYDVKKVYQRIGPYTGPKL